MFAQAVDGHEEVFQAQARMQPVYEPTPLYDRFEWVVDLRSGRVIRKAVRIPLQSGRR